MFGIYCADPALATAIVGALEFHGLEADPVAVNRRPKPAGDLGDQTQRIEIGEQVVALVRRQVPVRPDDRRLIQRLVDSACARAEAAERTPSDRTPDPVSLAAVIAYAAAGGGAVGSFERFVLTFVSDACLREPPVDRQDAKPAPMTNPNRRPNPPGSSSPVKTNPTRAIRSSRWSAGRKVAQE